MSAQLSMFVQRFQDKVAIDETGCWLWTGSTSNGYAQFRADGKTKRAHRWAWQQIHGGLEPRLDLDHLCRNRSCVNPDHLEPVTRRENVRRGARGEVSLVCRRGHWKLGDNLYVIPGSHHRVCRTCCGLTKGAA